jgi:hypothetical protein
MAMKSLRKVSTLAGMVALTAGMVAMAPVSADAAESGASATVIAVQAAASTNDGAGFSDKRASAGLAEPAATLRFVPVPADGKVNCHGYIGTFKVGSDVMVVDWDTTGVECFGVAPNRTIWHAWAGAGSWKTMPGNGRADDTWGAAENSSTGSRGVAVYVASSSSFWCQNYSRSGGWAGSWYQC